MHKLTLKKGHIMKNKLFGLFKPLMIQKVPKFGNSFLYSLGFLSMISFVLLIFTGVVMSLYGANWWLLNGVGKYFRSVHLWSTQAFVLFIILHLFVVFMTGAYKRPRRSTWILGVLMMIFALIETEFGYVLRGDFSAQWRSLQGADFYNGGGMGRVIDALNYKQIYGIHVTIIPLTLLAILVGHYILVRLRGIANHPRKGVAAKVVPANHRLLFTRGFSLILMVLFLSILLPSPYIKPITLKEVAETDPSLFAKTLVAEFNKSSDTAGYMDNIDPYTYDLSSIYIEQPYDALHSVQEDSPNLFQNFKQLPIKTQEAQLKELEDYYSAASIDENAIPKSEAADVVIALTNMAKAGYYQSFLASTNDQNHPGNTTTYITRFLADTGVIEDKATKLTLTTEQYGMIREESGKTPGAWWLSPIGLLNHTVLSGDENGDRDAAIIFGLLFLSMLAFPFIPWVQDIPDKLHFYKPFQRK